MQTKSKETLLHEAVRAIRRSDALSGAVGEVEFALERGWSESRDPAQMAREAEQSEQEAVAKIQTLVTHHASYISEKLKKFLVEYKDRGDDSPLYMRNFFKAARTCGNTPGKIDAAMLARIMALVEV